MLYPFHLPKSSFYICYHSFFKYTIEYQPEIAEFIIIGKVWKNTNMLKRWDLCSCNLNVNNHKSNDWVGGQHAFFHTQSLTPGNKLYNSKENTGSALATLYHTTTSVESDTCLIRFPMLYPMLIVIPIRPFSVCFTLYNPTLCLFRHKISPQCMLDYRGFNVKTYRII